MSRVACRLFLGIIALWTGMGVLAGCGGRRPEIPIGPDEQSSPAAVALFSQLQAGNKALATFKGLGEVSIVQNGQLRKFRAAWAGAEPDRLRIQLFGPTGQPVFSVACDGRYYYFLSPEEDGVIKKRVSSSGLKRYIEIPIGAADLLTLMCGRPTSPGNTPPVARIQKDALQETALVLLETSDGVVDHIYLDSRSEVIREIERRDHRGRLIWRAAFADRKMMDGFSIPNRITLSAENDVSVRIDVERFWANPSIANGMFVISDP